MIINVEGRDYEITNWSKFSNKFLNALGFSIVQEIQDNMRKAKLFDTGDLIRRTDFKVEGDKLVISNFAPYAPFIEYGTAGRRKGVSDPFGESSSGPNVQRKYPMKYLGNKKFELVDSLKVWAKHKGIKEDNHFLLAKHIADYGMEPFAPFRNVLYKQVVMNKVIRNARKFMK